jgi:hypothetical protein
MKVLQTLILSIILVFSFCNYTFGQADCGFDLRLFIRDSKGNPVTNASSETFGDDFYYNSATGSYNTWSLLGVGSKFKTILKVRSKGFEKFEKEIEITCGQYNYELLLKAKGTDEKVIFEELAQIQGIVKDVTGGVIPNTKVVLTDNKGITKTILANENGFYRFITKSGRYKLEFIGTNGFAPKIFEKFDLEKGYKNFDIVLDVRPCDDCEMIEGTVIKENKNNN